MTEYLSELGIQSKNKSGNYNCPLCHHDSFSIFEETNTGLCHCKAGKCTCSFKGDIFELYKTIHPNKTLTNAVEHFCKKLKIDYIEELKLETNLKWQLKFLAQCRQYFAFYNINVNNIRQKYTSINCEDEYLRIDSKMFYSILNGKIASYDMMCKVVNILRAEISDEDLDRYEKDRIRDDYYDNIATDYFKERKVINGVKRYFNALWKYYSKFV